MLAAQQLRMQLQTKQAQTIHLSCSEHPARWLVQQNVGRVLTQAGITFDTKAPTLHLGLADCAVRYMQASDRDSLQRIARVEIRASLQGQPLEDIIVQSTDLVARSEVVLLENPKYEFSSSVVPPAPRSTWDDIVEPLVILAAVATSVIVLFTVRSQ